MKTRIYNGVAHGDWVWCNQCGAIMLLPYGADQCPECCGDDTLMWVDDKNKEKHIDELGTDIINTNRTLKLEEYLDPETLQLEFTEYYKKLKGEDYEM